MDFKELLKSGELILVNSVLLTKEQHNRWLNANAKSEHYDLLQGVRKVLL
jgi:hypothetical protein